MKKENSKFITKPAILNRLPINQYFSWFKNKLRPRYQFSSQEIITAFLFTATLQMMSASAQVCKIRNISIETEQLIAKLNEAINYYESTKKNLHYYNFDPVLNTFLIVGVACIVGSLIIFKLLAQRTEEELAEQRQIIQRGLFLGQREIIERFPQEQLNQRLLFLRQVEGERIEYREILQGG